MGYHRAVGGMVELDIGAMVVVGGMVELVVDAIGG